MKVPGYLRHAFLSAVMAVSFSAQAQDNNKNNEIRTQQPQVENTQLSDDEPWMTDAFKNELSALNTKYEAKQASRKANTNAGRVYSGTSGAKGIIRTIEKKHGSDARKVIDVLSTGSRTVSRDVVLTKRRDFANAKDQNMYNRDYERLVQKYKRQYDNTVKAESKADGSTAVDAANKKAFQKYVNDEIKNNRSPKYQTVDEYVTARDAGEFEQKAAKKKTTQPRR